MTGSEHIMHVTPFPILLLALLTTASGCKTNPVRRAEDAVDAMRKEHDALVETVETIDAVNNSLDQLTRGDGNQQRIFEEFSDHVDDLLDDQKRLLRLDRQLADNQNDYDKAWEKTAQKIQDPELRQRSLARRQDFNDDFAEVMKLANETRSMSNPWIDQITDLRAFLASSLNPDGVRSVRDRAEQAIEAAGPVKTKFGELADRLEMLADEMGSSDPNAESKK